MKNKLLTSLIISTALIIISAGIWFYIMPAKEININEPVEIVLPLIVVDLPVVNSVVTSPLTVSGKARGYWFFEASFPIVLKDANSNTIGQGIAQAQGNWMTEDYVFFLSTINFITPATSTGQLILQKDNPSGLPENDDEIIIPVKFF